MDKMAYSVPELAKVLSIGRNTAYELIQRADFPKVTIGRRIIIPVDSLRSWLQTHSMQENTQN